MNRLVIGTVDIVIHAFCLEEVSQERKLPRGHTFYVRQCEVTAQEADVFMRICNRHVYHDLEFTEKGREQIMGALTDWEIDNERSIVTYVLDVDIHTFQEIRNITETGGKSIK